MAADAVALGLDATLPLRKRFYRYAQARREICKVEATPDELFEGGAWRPDGRGAAALNQPQ